MTTSANVANVPVCQNLSLENLKDELWKPIKGYEQKYAISNFGRVKSIARKVRYKSGKVKKINAKILRSANNAHYNLVTLCQNNTKATRTIHRLVAYHFIDNLNDYNVVNHIDGNKSNNHVSNLEWCTYRENELHSIHVLGKTPTIENLNKANKSENVISINGKRCYGEFLQKLYLDLISGKHIKASDEGYGTVKSQIYILRKRFGLDIKSKIYNRWYTYYFMTRDYIEQVEITGKLRDLDGSIRAGYRLL